MKTTTVLYLLLFSTASCLLGQTNQQWQGYPQAKVTVRVIGEDEQPIPGVTASFVFGGQYDYNHTLLEVKGETDASGLFTAQGYTYGQFGHNLSKDGYYMGSTPIPIFRDAKDGHWQPWGATNTAILRKIEKPVPVYAKKVRGEADIPAVGKPCGYDLEAGDWVAPHGRGKIADFIITLTNRHYESRSVFDVGATITFSNPLDGIQETQLPKEYATSEFKWPRQAPENGYQSSFAARGAQFPDGGPKPIRTFNGDGTGQAYFFRVRTVEQDGKIVSALYGKIDSGIVLDPIGSKFCGIFFTYYLNPTSLDRSMEFDLKRNLFTNLPNLELPRLP
jgi:hypothetical protein